MSDQIRIPLSAYQQARFAAMRADVQAIQARQNEAVTTIIAATHDPTALGTWSIELAETEIVMTPPQAPLALVPDEQSA